MINSECFHVLEYCFRVDGSMVLFLVTDGDFTSTDYQVRSASNRLSSLGVKIFTVGVGSAKKERLSRLSTDTFHYLCYEQWRDNILPVSGQLETAGDFVFGYYLYMQNSLYIKHFIFELQIYLIHCMCGRINRLMSSVRMNVKFTRFHSVALLAYF